MNRVLGIPLIIVLVLVGIAASNAFFTVRETQQAIVLQFGDFIRTVREPGLHFKLPFVQDVTYMDKRVLALDLAPEEVIAADEKRLVVDALVRFKIEDPLEFYKTVQGDETIARSRLGTTVVSNLRRVLGEEDFATLLTEKRSQLMTEIRDFVGSDAESYGVRIIDVRLKRADLPDNVSKQVFNRMQKEYNEQAAEIRASGQEEAQRIRAEAARDRTIIVSEAEKQAQILRGEGDGEAVRIFAEAFGKDVDFFEFYRSMQAYRETVGKDDTTMVLSPKSDFFKFLRSLDEGR